MNNRFKDYVRSGAFSLSLSPRMISVLLHMSGQGPEDDRLNLAPYQALHRRGLLSYQDGEGYRVTKEGELVAELLELAGLSCVVTQQVPTYHIVTREKDTRDTAAQEK